MVRQSDDLGPETLAWIRRAQAGDAGSFAQLYERIAPALQTWADLRIRPAQRAFLEPQDVVQEVWLRAWRALDDFDVEGVPFRLWVFRVAKNVLLEAFRQMRQADRGGVATGPSTRLFALQNLPDSATAISQRVARDENLRVFSDSIRALPEDDRKLVMHCGLEGLPYQEVADRLELSYEAVAKRWQRLRTRLITSGLPQTLLASDQED
jgi:RNA polymerase sigma-70 factor (ECF subfamily)